MSWFGRVKSALDSSPLFTPDFSLAVYWLRGDCKSPGFIGRTFFYSGLQIRWDASRKTIANPLGRLTEDRRLTESVRNPWSKNALLTQRNPMKKYPGEEWWRVVKSGAPLFTTRNPSVYRGFRRFGEEWRVKKRVGIFSPDVSFCAWQWQDIALVKGNIMP